jgi:hypothetical protein
LSIDRDLFGQRFLDALPKTTDPIELYTSLRQCCREAVPGLYAKSPPTR